MNHLNQPLIFNENHQEGLEKSVAKLVPKRACSEVLPDSFEEKINGEAFKASLRIQQLENENHRLKCLLKDFENDKFFQAHRIQELEQEKSRIKKVFAQTVIENQNLKESLQRIQQSVKNP